MGDHSSILKACTPLAQEPTMSITVTNSMRLALIELVRNDMAANGLTKPSPSHSVLLEALHAPSSCIVEIADVASAALKALRR